MSAVRLTAFDQFNNTISIGLCITEFLAMGRSQNNPQQLPGVPCAFAVVPYARFLYKVFSWRRHLQEGNCCCPKRAKFKACMGFSITFLLRMCFTCPSVTREPLKSGSRLPIPTGHCIIKRSCDEFVVVKLDVSAGVSLEYFETLAGGNVP